MPPKRVIRRADQPLEWTSDGHPAGSRRTTRARRRSDVEAALGAGAPLQQHDAGIVLQVVGLVVEHATHQPPERLRRGVALGGAAVDEVGQPFLAEELTLG